MLRNCPYCKGEIYASKDILIICKHCGGKSYYCDKSDQLQIGDARILESLQEGREKVEQEGREKVEAAINTGDWSDVPRSGIDSAAADIILTTSYLVAGREIETEIEVLTAECVYGMNIFRDLFASVRDIVGGRSAATQTVLRDARRTALSELKREALMVGGDAVIAIDLDYQELSGGGKNGMLMIVASGTAVKLKKPISK